MAASESPKNELSPGKQWKFSWPLIVVPLAILIPAGILVAKFISSDLTALDDHEITDEDKPIKADVLGNDYGLFNRGQLRIVDLQSSMSSQGLCGKARPDLAEIRESAVFFDPGSAFECLGADQEKDVAFTYVVEDVPASCEFSNAGELAKLSAEDTAEVQDALNDLLRTGSREPLLIDGVAGPKTRGAIGEWQQIYGFLPSEELSSQQHRCLLDQHEEAKDRSFGDRDAAQLIITVKGANDPPVAKDDRAATSQNASITTDVLNNDSDPDNGDRLRVVELEQSADRPGSAELRGNQIVFDPGDDFDGLAAGNTAIVPVAYVVEDGHGGRASALLTITVEGENDPPVANDDEGATSARTSIAVNVLKNDHAPDDDAELRIVDLQQGVDPRGSVAIRQNVVLFDPGDDFDDLAAGETANVTLTYVVEDVRSPASCEVSDANRQSTSSSVEETRMIQEALNGLLRPRLTPPLRMDGVAGSRTRWAIGEWQQQHGFARDEDLSSQQTRCLFDQYEDVKLSPSRDQATAQLIVTVKGENDRPVVEDDREITPENEPIVADVLRNDYDPDDGDQLRITDLTQPADFQGSAEVQGNAIFYDPGNAFDYLAAGETEDVTLTYVVEDSQGRQTDTRLTITVQGENDPPAARDDRGTTLENEPIMADVLGNDHDPDDGDQLRITDLTQPADFRGSAKIRDGAIWFDPGKAFDYLAAGETEDVTLTYIAEDRQGRRTDTRLTITVQGENDPPTTRDDRRVTPENEPIVAKVLKNDYDPDYGDRLRITDLRQGVGARGSAEIQGNAIFYDPGDAFDHLADGETEDVTLTYAAEDRQGRRTDTRLTITVQGENDPPATEDDRGITPENEPIVADVLKNDHDPDDGDQIRIADLVLQSRGSAEIQDNAIFYDPGSAFDHLAAGETEDVMLTYVVEDSHGRRADTQLTITVQGENEQPVDSDPEGATLQVRLAQFVERRFIRPFGSGSIVPINYRKGGCGLAASDQVSGVPFCARDNDRDRGSNAPSQAASRDSTSDRGASSERSEAAAPSGNKCRR